MNLKANIERESVSLSARDGYADAGATASGDMAAVEIEVEGEVRVYERDDGRPTVLTLNFSGGAAHMRRVALLMLERTGAPALTERQWRAVATELDIAAGREEYQNGRRAELRDVVDMIQTAYPS